MHVISASRRTDISAFYSSWFMNRIRDGVVGVRSPFGRRMFEVPLRPKDVIAIVFWTKNAAPLLPYLDELRDRGYPFTFLYTVNNYPSALEPRVPPLAHTLATLETLRRKVPNLLIRWRYDTIVFADELTAKWHVKNFSFLCKQLAPYTDQCIFSFCDYYRKTIRNMEQRLPHYFVPDEQQSRELAGSLAEIAEAHGMILASCAHHSLVSGSIQHARCIDPEWLKGAVDSLPRREALLALKTTPTRPGCLCAASRDIGAYDTCPHGCVYCYANANPEQALRNAAAIPDDAYCLEPFCSARARAGEEFREPPTRGVVKS